MSVLAMGKGRTLPNLGSYLAGGLLENVGGAQRLRRLAGLRNKRIALPDNMSKCERTATNSNEMCDGSGTVP